MDQSLIDATVERLRALGSDDAHTEVKASVKTLSKDVWDSISAFANTDGGLVILGLDEGRGFTPATGFTPGPIADALVSGLTEPEPKVLPIPAYSLDQAVVEGKPVVTLEIEAITGPGPCHVRAKGLANGSYRRVDDQDIRLTPYQIYLMQTRIEQTNIDRELVHEATTEDLDQTTITTVLNRLKHQQSRALVGTTNDLQRLRRLNIVGGESMPTLAGVLTMAYYPQQFFPQLFIDVAVHPGREKGSVATTRFIDRVQCEGPIPIAIQAAVSAVMRNLRTARVIDGTSGKDVPEIPEDVVREAIVNAVIHRDYSPQSRGQQVAVDIYSDRVTITNPGGFWGGVSPQTILDGLSRSRNDTLAKMLANVPLPSGGTVAENQGSGVARMVSAMRDHGLPIPEFDATIDQVRVTLSRFGLLDDETREWVDAHAGSHVLTMHQRIALVLANTLDVLTPQELRAQIGIDTDDARALLADLARRGLLHVVSSDSYQLPRQRALWPVDELVALSPTSAEGAILDVITDAPITIQELARELDAPAKSLRPVLHRLVTNGLITPTAPPTSRKRAYVRARQAQPLQGNP